MRIPLLSKLMWLGVGGVGLLALMNGRRRPPAADPMAADPADPVQDPDMVEPFEPLDSDLDVDAMSMLDRSVDIDGAAYGGDVSLVDDASSDGSETAVSDVGDLYGGHTPRAEDRVHPDDDAAMDTGQNWIEALETSAAENGPLPEQSLDSIVDDEDVYSPPHAGDSDDTPVADRGSGGPAGM